MDKYQAWSHTSIKTVGHAVQDSIKMHVAFPNVCPQVMPQLLNSLQVDSTGNSIDWGTLAVYTCSDSCERGDQYCREFIWKQDFNSEQHLLDKNTNGTQHDRA